MPGCSLVSSKVQRCKTSYSRSERKF